VDKRTTKYYAGVYGMEQRSFSDLYICFIISMFSVLQTHITPPPKKIVKGVERGQSDWIQNVLGRMFFQRGWRHWEWGQKIMTMNHEMMARDFFLIKVDHGRSITQSSIRNDFEQTTLIPF
jgi:hypothetical protein